MGWREEHILVDWGTTNRRAYLVSGAGELIESFADDLGLLAIPPGGFENAADDIRRRLGDRPMLLAGMVGSNRGWREAPYVACPAAGRDLADAILWVEPDRVGIVPGVCQSGTASPDVMRGEEIQVLGAVAAGLIPPDILVCHPGTHAKWIDMRAQRIQSFRTMMTGEVFGLLKDRSILADQLRGEVAVGSAFEDGAADSLNGGELLATLFRIRARHALGEPQSDAASYASGLLVGADVRAGLALHRHGPIALIGRPDLCRLYKAALAQAGHATIEVDGPTAFLAGARMLTEML